MVDVFASGMWWSADVKIHSVVLYLKAEVHYISVVVCGNCVVLGSLLLFVKYLCFVCMHDFGLNQQLCAMRWHFFFFHFFVCVSCVGHHIRTWFQKFRVFFVLFFHARNQYFFLNDEKILRLGIDVMNFWIFWIQPGAQVFDRDWESPRKIASLLYFRKTVIFH